MPLISSEVFTPKQVVPINLDKTTIYVYPTITAEMGESEKTYGFTLTKNALRAASRISFKARLDCLKQQMNAGSTVDVYSQRFISHSKTFMSHQANVSVVSYYGSNGRVIPNATDPATGHLKAFEGQTVANRRPAGIKYAKMICQLDFQSIDPTLTGTFPINFYVDLGPIETRNVNNSVGNAVELSTSFIAEDWAHSNQANYETVTLNNTSARKPFYLNPPVIEADINSDVTINISGMESRIEEVSLEAAWNTICSTVLQELCPTMVQDPATHLQSIHQSSKDHNGDIIELTVQEYYKCIKSYTDFFPKSGNWPLDVVQHFITHLNEDIRLQTQKDFSYSSSSRNMDAFIQAQNLLRVLQIASAAEKQKSTLSKQIQQHINGNTTMHAKVHMSAAEKVIQKYTEMPVREKPVKECWGCGQTDHVYAVGDTIVCPNKDLPGVKDKAAKVREDFRARRKASSKKRRSESKDKDKRSDKRVATVADVRALITELTSPKKADNPVHCLTTAVKVNNKSDNKVLALAFKAEMTGIPDNKQASMICTAIEEVSASIDDLNVNNDSNEVNCNAVTILLGTNPVKPPLPITFDTNIPHIQFCVGPTTDKSFGISMAYDTAAQLNVGYAGYHLSIAKAFPAVVKSLIWAKDQYSPLVLSGIVSTEKEQVSKATESTTLPAVIEYHTPYVTKEGAPVTMKIALGNNVSVNTIMGLSTIRNAAISLDFEAKVFQVGILDSKPFEIVFKPTSRGIPDVSPLKTAHPCSIGLQQPSSVTENDIMSCYKAVFESSVESASANKSTPKDSSGDAISTQSTQSNDKTVTFDEHKSTLPSFF